MDVRHPVVAGRLNASRIGAVWRAISFSSSLYLTLVEGWQAIPSASGTT